MQHNATEVRKKSTRAVRVKAVAHCFILDVSYINFSNLILSRAMQNL